jgi:hypothetical protein
MVRHRRLFTTSVTGMVKGLLSVPGAISQGAELQTLMRTGWPAAGSRSRTPATGSPVAASKRKRSCCSALMVMRGGGDGRGGSVFVSVNSAPGPPAEAVTWYAPPTALAVNFKTAQGGNYPGRDDRRHCAHATHNPQPGGLGNPARPFVAPPRPVPNCRPPARNRRFFRHRTAPRVRRSIPTQPRCVGAPNLARRLGGCCGAKLAVFSILRA